MRLAAAQHRGLVCWVLAEDGFTLRVLVAEFVGVGLLRRVASPHRAVCGRFCEPDRWRGLVNKVLVFLFVLAFSKSRQNMRSVVEARC